jgi:mRNA turnover protein 4
MLKHRYFKEFKSPDFAKAGDIPKEDIVITTGPISFSTSMLDQFRKLGMIVEINNNQLHIREPFIASKTGIPLTPEQAKVLTHFEIKLANFQIVLECFWSDGEFESII